MWRRVEKSNLGTRVGGLGGGGGRRRRRNGGGGDTKTETETGVRKG